MRTDHDPLPLSLNPLSLIAPESGLSILSSCAVKHPFQLFNVSASGSLDFQIRKRIVRKAWLVLAGRVGMRVIFIFGRRVRVRL